MDKKRTSVIMAFAAVLFLLNPAWSEEIKGRWAVGSRYRYFDADDADFRGNGNAANLNLTYGLTDNLALECEGGYYRLKSKAGTRLGVYSFHTNLQLRANTKKIVPYLTGGIGFQHYRYRDIGEGDRRDKRFSYSYKTGAGAEYFINKNWAVNIEADYIYGNTGGKATLDVYGWQYGGGVKYYF